MKRWTALLAVLVAVSGCGDPAAPEKGAVVWRIDGITCEGSGAIQLFVDGELVGTETLAAGGAGSKAYAVDVGQHLIGAKEASFTWPNSSVTISKDETYTSVLTCQ